MSKKIVIVGGVAGGASAAARLRRLDETANIILFEREEHVSFANCGLPYYIGDVIEEREKLLVQTVDGMSKRFNLDIRNFSEVTRIHRDRQTISVTNVQTKETYEESYDVLIISTEEQPIVPSIPKIDEDKNIFTLRNNTHTDQIKEFIQHHQHKKAAVIGGGFIVLDIAP